MNDQTILESIKIPTTGYEIANRMHIANENNNTDFYQSLFWHDIILLNDTRALNEFIITYCPYVEKNNLATLAIKFRKRTISDYHTFFGTNM